MIVLILILILAGSLAGAATAWMQGAFFWGIALGYAAGGWAGLILGLALALLPWRLRSRPRNRRPPPADGALEGSKGSLPRK